MKWPYASRGGWPIVTPYPELNVATAFCFSRLSVSRFSVFWQRPLVRSWSAPCFEAGTNGTELGKLETRVHISRTASEGSIGTSAGRPCWNKH